MSSRCLRFLEDLFLNSGAEVTFVDPLLRRFGVDRCSDVSESEELSPLSVRDDSR